MEEGIAKYDDSEGGYYVPVRLYIIDNGREMVNMEVWWEGGGGGDEAQFGT